MTEEYSIYVIVRTRFEGWHYWHDAPDECAYLRNRHRHIFHVSVRVPVIHDDRDIEFIDLKHKIDDLIKWKQNQEGEKIESWSCEKWALWLADEFNAVAVEVSEDGENGAFVARNVLNEEKLFNMFKGWKRIGGVLRD